MKLLHLVARVRGLSLAAHFLIVGGTFSLVAMLVVGFFVTNLIATSVTQNSAVSTALYVDSVIAPLLPDMQGTDMLDASVIQALDETLRQSPLADRIVTFRLWRRDGTILYSRDKSQNGRSYTPSEDLKAAFRGKTIGQFDQVDDIESASERGREMPLLEIYNPVLQPWSGEIVAVSEFYEDGTEFEKALGRARWSSWGAVAGATLLFFLCLSAIVLRGNRTINMQSRALRDRVQELSDLLIQNEMLRDRVQRASARAVSLNEMYLRRISADLHDGPAQLVALAALRLDSEEMLGSRTPMPKRKTAVLRIKSILEDALSEVRSICNGLTLPNIGSSDLCTIIVSAVKAHELRTGSRVKMSISTEKVSLSQSEKICSFRFLQEALHNSFRHGGGINQTVRQKVDDDVELTIEVEDEGPGFDPEAIRPDALGLAGLRERVQSLGGQFLVTSSVSGTRISMKLTLGAGERDEYH